MTNFSPLDPVEQEALVREIGVLVASSSPSGWENVDLSFRSLGRFSSCSISVRLEDGSKTRIPTPKEAMKKMGILRSGMYRPRAGTWFSSDFSISNTGKYRIDYNYENEPDFEVPPELSQYVLDLEHFPRDEERIPEWLRRKVQEAEESGEET